MRIFIDSADPAEIAKYMDWGICDGVTTNPTILAAAGCQGFDAFRERSCLIAGMIDPRPLSLEVMSDEPVEMLRQAREFATWAQNVIVKITITSRTGESCLPVIHQLSRAGIQVNATALMTANQAILASKAGARYVSLFGGRIDDEGSDAALVVRHVRDWLDRSVQTLPQCSEIIVGSSRTTKNIVDWALAGAHVITVTPSILSRMLINARTKETVAQFLDDAKAVFVRWSGAQQTELVIRK